MLGLEFRYPSIFRASVLIGVLGLVGCGGPPPDLAERSSLGPLAKEIVSLAIAPDGTRIAARTPDLIRLWDLDSGREVASFDLIGPDNGSVVFSPDSQVLVADQEDGGAIGWDLAGDKKAASARFPRRPGAVELSSFKVADGWGLAFSPDGKTLAAGSSFGGENGFVTLWEVGTGRSTSLGGYNSPVTTVAFGRDGRTLAAGGVSGSVDLWDLSTRGVRATLEAQRAFLSPVAFSPDGAALAIPGDDRRIQIWDVATGQATAWLKGHLKVVLAVAFHPEGKLLASGDSGGTIYVWDLATLKPIAWVKGRDQKVWGLAFTPDGKTLASAGEDRLVHLWDASGLAGGR